MLEVSVEGDVNPDTGMIINIYELKPMIKEVLKDFDHKYLNEDNPHFRDIIPTTENMARILWDLLDSEINEKTGCTLFRIRLFETPELFVDYTRV